MAVPPLDCSPAIPCRTRSRSVVGRTRISASLAKLPGPTRRSAGTWSSRPMAACLIAWSRVGATSSARVLPETSTTSSSTLAGPAGSTSTVGRAAARTMPATAR